MKNNCSRILALAGFVLSLSALPILASQDKTKSLDVKLDANNLLSIINPIDNEGEEAKQAFKIYYDRALPLAASHGYQNHGVLRVTETVTGNDQPGIFVLASWPSEQADLTFETLPEWQDYKKLRPTIWRRLDFYKAEASYPTHLKFREDKFYTMAFAWFDEENNEQYAQYLTGIKDAVSEAGGKYMHSMKQPRFVTHSSTQPGPNQITFVQWDSHEGLERFLQSDGFQANAPLLRQGTTRFDVYRVKPVIKN